MSYVHISDLTSLYSLLISSILRNQSIPSGEEGYYFALAHKLHWHEVLDRLAAALHSRGLVNDTEIKTWGSDEEVAKVLEYPEAFVQAFWNSG